MADAVTSQTLVAGHQTAVFKFTNISDGSGESAVKKVDVSALATNVRGEACTRATIEKIWWQCNGMKVKVLFDASDPRFAVARTVSSSVSSCPSQLFRQLSVFQERT